MKNWKTTVCGAAVAGLTVAQDGVEWDNPNWWIKIVVAVSLVLAKDSGVSGTQI